MSIIASGLTDIGRKRNKNQDAIYVDTERHYFVVADGMGGHQGGEMASQMAVQYATEFVQKNLKKNSNPEQLSRKAILFAHEKIYRLSQENDDFKGMGTTFNGLLFQKSKLYISNVGDSRCYLIHRGEIYQCTKDHSLIQEKMNLGIQTREQAAKDEQKHILVKTVGFNAGVEVDIYSYQVSRHDIFLSCSDGLYGKVSDPDILYIIKSHITDPKNITQDNLDRCTKSLIDQANANGGNDNISVILVAAL